MKDENFWLELGVSPRELNESGDKWQYVRGLFETYAKEKKILLDFLKRSSFDETDLSHYKKIMSSPRGKALFGLHKYQINKIEILQEFFAKINDHKKVVSHPDRPFLALLELYDKESDRIIDSAYYYFWKKSKIFEVWFLNPPITKDTINLVKENERSILITGKKLLNKQIRQARNFEINEEHYFCYERQKKESVLIGYDEKKPLRKKGSFYLKISSKDNLIEIRTQDYRIGDLFLKTFAKFNHSIFVDSPDPIERDAKEIIKKVLDYDGDKIEITQISFNYLEKNIACKSSFKKNGSGTRLIDALDPLISNGFIDTSNYKSIMGFTISVDDFERNIRIDKTNEDYVLFTLKREGLVEEKYNAIAELLKSELNLELETEYTQSTTKIDKKSALQEIIGKYVNQITPSERTVYEEVKALEILETVKEKLYVCTIDYGHRFTQEHATCPKCKNKLKECPTREKILINEIKLLEYLKNKLNIIFGEGFVDLEKSPDALRLKTLATDVMIIPKISKNRNMIKNIIDKWSESLIPSLQIISGKRTKSSDVDHLSSEIYLYDLLYEKDDVIKSEIEQSSIKKYEQLIESQSEISKNKLHGITKGQLKVKGDQYEEITYPIFKHIFYEAIPWGKNARFKTVPDGIYGIKMSSRKSEAFSLIYDCKYSDTRYDLDADEKRKAKDYIKRAGQAKGIQSYSGKLSAYMIIGQKVDETDFKNFADGVNLYRRWKGKNILLSSESLIYLYEKFKKEYSKDISIKVAVNMAFAKYIRDSEERNIILNKKEIDEILKLAEELKGTLDTKQIFEHLKTGIEY